MSNAADLQQRAEQILSESRFQERRTPGPFRGLLRRLGDFLEPALGPIGRFLVRVGDTITDWWSDGILRVVLVVGVIGFAVLLSALVIRRRSAVGVRGRPLSAIESDDPAELDRAADRAEASGDYPEAVRLRFQAGVLRLQRNGHLRRGRSMPTRAIARQIKVTEFDAVGRTFDAVAYGGRDATAEDAAAAQRGWDRVLAETSKRS